MLNVNFLLVVSSIGTVYVTLQLMLLLFVDVATKSEPLTVTSNVSAALMYLEVHKMLI